MPLPIAANVTFDLYRAGAVPPTAPTAAGLVGHLQAAPPEALAVGRHVDDWQRFTHRLLVGLDVDVRDRFDGGSPAVGVADVLYVPDRLRGARPRGLRDRA